MGDACLTDDPKSKVACETATKDNMVMVAGEITTQTKIDYESVVRGVVAKIGFFFFFAAATDAEIWSVLFSRPRHHRCGAPSANLDPSAWHSAFSQLPPVTSITSTTSMSGHLCDCDPLVAWHA